MSKFGDKFRKERERQSIKLEDVSNSTKISSRMLRAIEDEHFDQLPGGVFNKGFIRAYAKHLGLDEEEAVAGYLATLNQQNGNQPPSASAPRPTDRRTANSGERWHAGNDRRSNDRRQTHRRASDPEADELPDLQLPKAEHIRPKRKMAVYSDSGGIPWTVTAMVALVVVAAAFWWSHSRNARANASNAAPAIAPAAATPPNSTPPDSENNGAAEKSATSSPSSLHSAAKAASRPVSSSSASPVAFNSATTNEAAQPDATPPAPRPRANLTLVIRASENSWISVIADGQSVLHETLIAPASTSVRAARQITVRAGNAAGVTFSLNGEDFPAQGAEGEVKTLIFDPSGMRPVEPPPAPATPAATAAPPAPVP